MIYRFIIYSYLAASFLFAFYTIASVKPKKMVINYIIMIWFLINPVVNSRIFRLINPIIRYTGRSWRFNLHFSVLLLGIIILRFLTVKNAEGFINKKKKPTYEKFLYMYFLGSMAVWYIHYLTGNLPPEYLNVRMLIDYTAVFFYIALKRHIDRDTVECILRSIIFMAVISTLFAFPQFFYDRWIMRTDRMAFAFSEFRRSSGIFVTPHDHSMFLGSAILMSDMLFENKIYKYTFMVFLIAGVILTFNRSTWIGVFLAGFIYIRKYYKSWLDSRYALIILISVIGFTVYQTYLSAITERFTQTDMYQQRLASDTGSQRVLLWNMGTEVLKENVFIGLGDKRDNPVYYKLMYAIGGRDWAMGKGGGIHNLAIEELVHKGIFISVALILFFVALFRHISRENKDKNMFYIAVFGYLTVYAVFQQFGASFVNSNNGMLALFYAAMVSAVYYNNIDLSEYSMLKKESHRDMNEAC